MNAKVKGKELAAQELDQLPTGMISDGMAIIAMIERAARDPSVDIEKMKQLMAMHKEVVADEARRAFDEAMSRAQAQMGSVAADSNNPQTKSRYASYYALDKAVRPIYTANGFALSYDTSEGAAESMVRVTCRVSHRCGHSINKHVDMAADGKGAKGGDVMTKTHAIGSAISYGMRNLLKMIFNIAIGEGDDDGNSASSVQAITAEQADTINKMIVETKSNVGSFLTYMKVPSVADIPAAQYEFAVDILNRKKTQVAGAKA